MRPARRLAAVAAALAATLAGCGIPEARRAEADREDLSRKPLIVAHIAAPRLAEGGRADESAARFEGAVGVASGVLGLDAVVFGGDVIANESAAGVKPAVETFASIAGIVAAKRFVVLGEREHNGAAARADVAAALEAKGILPARTGTYSAPLRPGVRLIVLDAGADGAVSADARKALEETLRDATEPVILVAADRPPADEATAALLKRDARVKAVLFRAAKGGVTEVRGEPLAVSTPALDAAPPAITTLEVMGRKCKVRVLASPAGSVLSEWSGEVR